MEFFVEIYDIQNIQKQKLLKEIKVYGESKSDAIDKAHTEAQRLFPDKKRFVHIR